MAEAHPVGFQWVMEAKKRGAKVIHVDPRFTRTSALAHTLRPAAGRRRHRVPRRDRQLHPEQRAGLPGVRARLHQRGHDRQRGLPGHRGPGRAVLRLRPGDQHLRPGELAVRRARSTSGQDEGDAHADRETAAGLQHESHGPPVPADVPARPDAAAPALRLPDPQAALRPLHPRGGRAGLRRTAGEVPRGLRGVDRQLGPRAHHRAGLLGGLDPAQRRRAVHPHRRDHPAAAGQHGPARAAA